jgi:hypothetical protein
MTSISMLAYEVNGHRVSIPKDASLQWVEVDYEMYQRDGTHLIQYGLQVYEWKKNELSLGKDHAEWFQKVNEPVRFEEWEQGKCMIRSPRQFIIDDEIYQVKHAHLCWPRPILYRNGEPVARIRDRKVVWR